MFDFWIEGSFYLGFKRPHTITRKKHQGNFWVINFTSWWLNQPLWKILVKMGIFPKIGVKIKNIWNHQPVYLEIFACKVTIQKMIPGIPGCGRQSGTRDPVTKRDEITPVKTPLFSAIYKGNKKPSLKLTAIAAWKSMDAWNTFSFPFRFQPIFRAFDCYSPED